MDHRIDIKKQACRLLFIFETTVNSKYAKSKAFNKQQLGCNFGVHISFVYE